MAPTTTLEIEPSPALVTCTVWGVGLPAPTSDWNATSGCDSASVARASTVTVTEANTSPAVAVISEEPRSSASTKPVCGTTLATCGFPLDQRTPEAPLALNCCELPTCSATSPGVMAITTSGAVVPQETATSGRTSAAPPATAASIRLAEKIKRFSCRQTDEVSGTSDQLLSFAVSVYAEKRK
jgi:hypothetical protein